MDLLEREDEAQLLRALAARAAAGVGRCVVVAGPAGVGKTALLQSIGADQYAAGGELEDDVPFGVVRDLLTPLAQGPPMEAPEAAALAPVFEAELLAPEPGAVLHGLYRLVAGSAAARSPLTLVVDDVQWADPASVRFLAYLARRIADLPCLLVLGLRTGREARGRADVQSLVAQNGVQQVTLSPLTAEAVGTLLGGTLGEPVDLGFAEVCHTATGGNPLLCVTTAQELARRGVRGQLAERADIEPIGAAGVATWVNRRVAACGPAAADLAIAVAVLGPSATYGRTLALIGERASGEGPAEAVIDALVAERILEDARPLAFTHPILRTSVLDDLSPGARARWHARAARLLAAEGLDEPAAHHLRLSEPLGDAASVELLRAAARAALGRGAADVAVTYLARALAEPPSGDLRAVVLMELGMAELPAGERTAIEHLEQGLAAATDPGLQVQIAATLADALIWARRWQDAVTVLEAGIAAIGAEDLVTPLHWQLMRAATGSAKVRRATAQRLAPIRGRLDFDPAEQVAMGFMAAELSMTGGPVSRAAELAHGALGEDGLPNAPIPGFAEVIALALALSDEPAAATRTFDAAVAQTRAGGRPAAEAWIRVLRGWAALRSGRPVEAEADALAALGLEEADVLLAGANAVAVSALIGAVLEQRGAAAARQVSDIYSDVPVDEDLMSDQPLALARAQVALAERNPDLALRELARARAWEAEFGEPSIGWVPWRPLAVEALLLKGDPQQAAALAAEHRRQAEAFGAPSVRGAAIHAQARVERDVALMEEAVAVLRDAPAPTALASALIDLGAMLRGRHEPASARTPLREAMDIAERAGAIAIADRARDELRAAGGRVRRAHDSGVEGLTPAESRVCRLAAQGLTNRQIAESTFVSPRTVEMHLSNAYRKLGITSREELSAADWNATD